MAEDLLFASIAGVAKRFRSGESSPVELTQAFLDRISRLDSRLHAFIRVRAEAALADAEVAGRELAKGVDRGPLHGVPIALKDQFDAVGETTTAGSRFERQARSRRRRSSAWAMRTNSGPDGTAYAQRFARPRWAGVAQALHM